MENEPENKEITQPENTTTEQPADANVMLKTRLSELEKTVAGKDSEVRTLKQTNEELAGTCKTISDSLTAAVAGYKRLVITANPTIPEELITGESIDDINRSLENARALVLKVKQGVEAEMSLTKVPTGSPERSTPDLSSLTPGEKIRFGLGGK
jgi:cell division septum initiation protein DivIVA